LASVGDCGSPDSGSNPGPGIFKSLEENKMARESKKFDELRGFRTLYPSDLLIYKYIQDKLEGVIKNWGYFPIEPPALEYGEALMAKGGLSPEQARELFIFKDHDDRWIGLRFDLTTPIARIVGYNYESFVTKMPIRWYYFSKMWRYDNDPKKGRYREFWQFGIELIGSLSPMADAETIAIAIKQLSALGFSPEKVKIFVSHRELLWGIISKFTDDEEKIMEIIRLIDKKEKLKNYEITGRVHDLLNNVELESLIEELLDLKPAPFEEIYSKYFLKIEKLNEKTRNAVENLKNTFTYLDMLLNEEEKKFLLIDPSIARGFDYYTGIIYEVYIYSGYKRQGGSILGGGRYDNLIDLYGGLHTPSIGFALGVDRCVEALREIGINDELKSIRVVQDVHIILDIKDKELLEEGIKILETLRKKNISATITLNSYSSWRKMLKNELEYADANGVPFTIIIDENVKKGNVILKNMKNRLQELVEIKSLIELIRG